MFGFLGLGGQGGECSDCMEALDEVENLQSLLVDLLTSRSFILVLRCAPPAVAASAAAPGGPQHWHSHPVCELQGQRPATGCILGHPDLSPGAPSRGGEWPASQDTYPGSSEGPSTDVLQYLLWHFGFFFSYFQF